MFINSMLKDIKKEIKLKKLSEVLGKSVNMADLQDMANDLSKKDKALAELYLLSVSSKDTNKHLEEYKIDKEKFKEIYRKLILLGTGQWAGEHYVAASSLAYDSTLEYILEKLEKANDEDLTVSFADIPSYLREAAFNLIEYFEKEKTGKIESSI